MDCESDNFSFIHSLSKDETEIKLLQKDDPDISLVLDWIEARGSRPPQW